MQSFAVDTEFGLPHAAAAAQTRDDSELAAQLLFTLAGADDLYAAAEGLARELQQRLELRGVAVALSPAEKGACRLAAVAGIAEFDPRAPQAAAMEAAVQEALLRKAAYTFPPRGERDHIAARALQHVAEITGSTNVAALPLLKPEGTPVGVVLCFGAETESLLLDEQRAAWLSQALARQFDLVRQAQPGLLKRCLERGQDSWRRRKTWAIVVLLIAAGVCACWPVPYRIAADCTWQPMLRRFVTAQQDGILARSEVAVGDEVQTGQVLARMLDREMRVRRAGLEAALKQAEKDRDKELAQQHVAAAQLAALEIQRIQNDLRLLDYHQEHLEVRSPLEGIVIEGDLADAEGARIEKGQTLYEIAPLERMTVEVAIPQDEISHVRVGMRVDLQTGAFPDRAWQGEILRIRPQAEIRDDASVFIAEVELANDDYLMRPGMTGAATIVAGRQSWAWILLHRPWYRLRQFFVR